MTISKSPEVIFILRKDVADLRNLHARSPRMESAMFPAIRITAEIIKITPISINVKLLKSKN